MNDAIRSVAIVGAGAMGTLFAARLAGRTDVPVTLLSRSFDGAAVEVEGEGRYPVRVVRQPEEPTNLLIVLVKAHATADAIRWAAGAIGPETLLLTLQNGLGNAETLASVAGPERVLAGVTSQGATRLAPGAVRHGVEGPTAIAPWVRDGRAARLVGAVADLFRQARMETTVYDDPQPLLWRKLLINAAVNPLTALLRVPTGELLSRPQARSLMRVVAEEVAAVAAHEAVPLPDDPVGLVEGVVRATAGNRTSMLQDVEQGRLTEIDAITGEVVQRARRHGVPVPVNETLLRLVSALRPS